jgi:hypothetical protein
MSADPSREHAPVFEHVAREADMPTDPKAGHPARAYRIVDPSSS